jgi:6,7-dimethyl-8-ribityllumazine synthase
MASQGNEEMLKHLPQVAQGNLKVVIVKTEWNAFVTNELEKGARKILKEVGIHNIHTLVVPGAVEIPFAIRQAYNSSDDVDAFIAFACVIRGDTPHFEYVCQSVTDGITQLNLSLDAPVIYGVLTVNTEEQAHERIGGKHGHKGEEAAITALKMIALKKKLEV